MSRLSDLLRQVGAVDEALAKDLQREVDALADRRAFGLNFERHVPEAVELPGRKVRKGDKVHILPERGKNPTVENERLWRVTAIERDASGAIAELEDARGENPERRDVAVAAVEDLVVVAEFRDPIYPGLVSTGKVERGGDKPYHVVINAENFHALQTLLFTHRHGIDLIYLDPPYNTGNEWTYNDKYVAGNDLYRHSKWLAFMERRLKIAAELLSSAGVLCVSIGSDEVHHLKLLVEQSLPQLVTQVITVQVTAGGKATSGINTLNEYLICATPEDFLPRATSFTGGVSRTPWEGLVLATFDRTQRPNQAYPIFIEERTSRIHSVGSSLAAQAKSGAYKGTARGFRFETEAPPGTVAVWPITAKGEECVWRLAPDRLLGDWEKGYIKVSPNRRRGERNLYSVQYLPAGVITKVESGEIETLGTEENLPTLRLGENRTAGAAIPSIWTERSHRTQVGNDHLKLLLGDKRFPYPKPVDLIADIIRGFAQSGQSSTVLDFFGGSGTTLEAVMKVNAEDGGCRQTVFVTNNEVSAEEAARLRKLGLRRGETDWEDMGVFEHVARTRIVTAATGFRPNGSKYSDGFDENIEFFALTYESPLRMASSREFLKVAPLLWMRAGSRGRRIEDLSFGWDVSETYGVLADLDETQAFIEALAVNDTAKVAFIVTDEDRLFEAVVSELPEDVEPVRLYEAYLRNFEIETDRSAL